MAAGRRPGRPANYAPWRLAFPAARRKTAGGRRAAGRVMTVVPADPARVGCFAEMPNEPARHELGRPEGEAFADRVRVAILTPRGRGALAVVGVAGSGACDLADRCFRPRGGRPLASRADGSICVGVWRAADSPDAAGEELVVVRRSSVSLEIHCHGGLAAPAAVLASLEARGARRQAWEEWLADEPMTASEREARLLLPAIGGPRAARILARQCAGCLDHELHRIAALAPGPRRTEAVSRLLRAARVGLRLAEPWRVVLAGPVNAGKSSLANALAGHARSIVSAEPGTTRDLVTARIVLGGWEVELVDTAGLRIDGASASATERAGIQRAVAAAAAADLVLRIEPVVGGCLAAGPADGRELLVVTKTDLAPAGWSPPPGAPATSAVEGRGIAELAEAIVDRLVPELRVEPDLLSGPVPFTPRQVEAIRRLA